MLEFGELPPQALDGPPQRFDLPACRLRSPHEVCVLGEISRLIFDDPDPQQRVGDVMSLSELAQSALSTQISLHDGQLEAG